MSESTWLMQRRAFLHSLAATASVAALGRAQEKPLALPDKKLLVHQVSPDNAEPPLADLVAAWQTPGKHFYVRSHGKGTPKIESAAYRLSVEGLVDKPTTFTLAQLQERFKQHTAAATLTCAGNRRVEHSAIKKVSGVPWQAGAIGNATWTGPRLLDVLRAAGIKTEARHVWFEGLDDVEHGDHPIKFGGSIPLEKAAEETKDACPVLLAHAQSDAPLAPAHGFPLRTIVPGYIGARSVKWLAKLVVSDRPSPNHFLADTYKLVTTDAKTEVDRAAPIYENVINSVICTATLTGGNVKLAGYALPSGKPNAVITAVEISLDEGKSWRKARLDEKSQGYCWRLWSLETAAPAGTKSVLVRATDSSGATQPATPAWNLKGYLFNGWHRAELKG